jgi:DNA modification methylase
MKLSSLKQAFEKAGGHWQSFIIWVKNTFTLSRSDYQNQYEPIMYGWRDGVTNHYFIDDRSQGYVWLNLDGVTKYKDGKTVINIAGNRIELDGQVTGRILKGKQKTDIWEFDKPSKT